MSIFDRLFRRPRAPTPEEAAAAKAAADAALNQVAPSQPTPQSPWDAVKRSPVHRLLILCNGEASADKDEHGRPVDGTGNKCKHYWSARRIPDLQNSDGVIKGESLRRCVAWVSAEGPMEFGEGREHMCNYCDFYEPSSPPRPYNAATEQKPPNVFDDGDIDAPEYTKLIFEPGTPPASAFVVHSIYGRLVENIIFTKDKVEKRWALEDKLRDTPEAIPFLYVPFRVVYNVEEYAHDTRYPVGDVRRYDKDRLFALELCMAKAPLKALDWEAEAGAVAWAPVLNKAPLVTISDVLGEEA